MRGEKKIFARYVSLSVLGMLGVSCYILADTFFVSQGMGTDGLAALNLAIPVYNVVYGTGMMLGVGGATRYCICKAQGDKGGADKIFTSSLALAAAVSAVFLSFAFFSGALAKLLGADARTYAMTEIYLRVLLLFSPAFVFNAVLMCFVRNDGAPHTAMFATLSGSFLNILLDYVFIFPCKMGMFGAVLATGCAPVIGLLFSASHIWRGRSGFRLCRSVSPALWRYNFLLGFPVFVEQMSSAVVIFVFNFLFLRFAGNTGVAAYGVIANVSLVVLALFNGIAQGVQPLLSEACGKSDNLAGRRLFRSAAAVTLCVAAAVYVLLAVFASGVCWVFNGEHSAAMQEMAERGIRLYFLAAPFAGWNILLCARFSAEQKPLPAHILSLLRGLVFIVPAAFAMAALWAETGIWLAFPVSEAFACAVSAGFFVFGVLRRGRKKSLKKQTQGKGL